MKILLLCSKSSVVINFRKKLIEKLQENGHQVCALAFDNEHEETIRERNVEFHYFNDANRSLNPFKILSLKNRYAKVIKEINPDLVFTFMLKPNIYGVQGAKKAGITNVYSMVEGAGESFVHNSLKWKIIRFVIFCGYKKAFKISKKIFFLNEDDKREFVEKGLADEAKSVLINGIGVDLEKFSQKPIKNKDHFLMIARLVKEKGVFEYCEAAKIVKAKFPCAKFGLLGSEGTVTAQDLKSYIEEGIIMIALNEEKIYDCMVDLGTDEDLLEIELQAIITIMHEVGHGIVDWYRYQFEGEETTSELINDIVYCDEDEEEDLCEEFGESWASSYTGVYGSKIADSLTEYDNVDIA